MSKRGSFLSEKGLSVKGVWLGLLDIRAEAPPTGDGNIFGAEAVFDRPTGGEIEAEARGGPKGDAAAGEGGAVWW